MPYRVIDTERSERSEVLLLISPMITIGIVAAKQDI
jgi:hypothetical protein